MGANETRKMLTEETPVSDYLPYSRHITSNIISTKNAEYMTVWKLTGRSHECADEEDIYIWRRELNNLLKGIGSPNISFWTHTVRRRVFEYPESSFDNAFCKHLDQKYRKSFEGFNLMVNELYLTVVYKPVSDAVIGFLSRFEKQSYDERLRNQQYAIKKLEDVNRQIRASMRRKYDARILSTYTKDNSKVVFSRALEFLAFLGNGEWLPMPVCRNHFSDYMAVNRPLFDEHGEVGEIRKVNKSTFFAMSEFKEYPDPTEPGHLNILLETPYEYVLSQSFSCLSRHAAKGLLEKQKQQLIDAKDVAESEIREIGTALDELISGKFIMGEHHATLCVFGESPNDVRDHLAEANGMLMDVGITPVACDRSLEAAFYAQLPANWKWRPRPSPINSRNFLSFSSFHNFMSGKPAKNPWGPAVTILKTISGTPLYFNFHVSRPEEDATGKKLPGNTMLLGKTGSGKTVTMAFLIAQAQKYRPRLFAFDKDRGLEIFIRAIGGKYYAVKNGLSTGWNPLQLEPTHRNISFLRTLLKMLATASGTAFSHQDEKELNHALQTIMFEMERPNRRLSILVQSIPMVISTDANARPSLHDRLQKWCEGGELGWVFDNQEDLIDLKKHRAYGFDVTDFLDNPEVCSPIIKYLNFRKQEMIQGDPFFDVADEFWKILENNELAKEAKNKNKTIRKERGLTLYATQEPGDALESAVGSSLIQQTSTFILLPNPKAEKEHYVDKLKLTESEFKIVKELDETSRCFLIKQGSNSALAQLDLNGFDDEMLILSGSPENAEILEGIIEEVGENPDVWMPIFINRVKGEEL